MKLTALILTLFCFAALSIILFAGVLTLFSSGVVQPTVITASLADWFTWDTALYLIIIVLGGLLTLVSLKYRSVMVELKELLETIRKAYEDKALTDVERKAILKEGLDVLRELIYLAWKPIGLTAKAIKRAVR